MSKEIPHTLLESYRNIQHTAMSFDEIASWFQANPEILGALPTHSPGKLTFEVKLSIAAINLMLSGRLKPDGLKSVLEIVVKADDLPPPTFSEITGLGAFDSARELEYRSKFIMKFEEWSYAIALFAFDYVNRDFYADVPSGEWTILAEKILTKYLPVHFPSIDINWLKTISDLGILSVEPDDDKYPGKGYVQDEFISMLYATRNKTPSEPLPCNLSI